MLTKPSTFKVADVMLPDSVSNWPRVRVAACGICGSDLGIYDRDPPIPKYWPGHEIAGFIDEKLVVVNPLISCGMCANCLNGETNICKNARMISHHLPGGFAEYVPVPAGNISQVHTTTERAVFVEPLASSLHMLNVAQLAEGHKVVIVGGGTIGLLLIQLAYQRGATSVKLIARYSYQDKLGAKFGSYGGNVEPDIVLVAAAGDGSALESAVNTAKPHGRVVVLGNIYQSRALNLKWLVEHELTVMGSHRYSATEFESAVKLIESCTVEVEQLVTHQFSLGDITSAYAAAKDKVNSESVKVLVKPMK